MTVVDSHSQASALQSQVLGSMNQLPAPSMNQYKQQANLLLPSSSSGLLQSVQSVQALCGINPVMSAHVGLSGMNSVLPARINVKTSVSSSGSKKIHAPMPNALMPSLTALDEFQNTLIRQQQEHQLFLANYNLMAVSATKNKGLKRPHSSIGFTSLPGPFGIENSLGLLHDSNTNPVPQMQTTQKKTRNGRRVCLVDGCIRFAQGKTKRCISHGGGKRCGHAGCPKSAYGSTKFCIAHGGGERCEVVGCTKSSQGSTKRCKAHGGGRRCKVENCPKSAQGSMFCKAHGGGKRCLIVGCTKQARGRSGCCISHSRIVKWS